MGDRVVVEVTGYGASECAVLLYSHWGGSDAPAVVASALRVAPDRWDDPGYLARVILDRFTVGRPTTTGAGIYPSVSMFRDMGEWPVISVACAAGAVSVYGECYGFADLVKWGDPSWAFNADDEVCGLVDGAAVSA